MTVRYLRLAEVCDINPRLPRTHALSDDDEVSFVPMAAVDEVSGAIRSAEVRRFAEVKKGYTSFADGDVLFAKITPCMENGKAALAGDLVGGRGFGSTEFHVLRAGNQVMPEWLRYFVRRETFRRDAKRNFTGTAGQQRVPTSFLQNALIPVPPRAEQQHIVDLLSRAEGIVRLRRQAQRMAAELIPAIFVDMFGDPTLNPKRWRITRLGDLLSAPIRNGISPARAGRVHGKVLTLSAITRGGFDETSVKESTFASPLASSDEVRSVDFLVCRGNGNRMLVGAGCFPLRDMPGVAFPDTAIAVRPAASLLDRAYFSALWGTAFVRRQIDAIAKTTNGTFKINQSGLADIRVLLPELERQTAFARQAEAVESIQSQQALALQKATATFDALLAQAFASERAAVTTREAEEAVS